MGSPSRKKIRGPSSLTLCRVLGSPFLCQILITQEELEHTRRGAAGGAGERGALNRGDGEMLLSPVCLK